MGEATERDNNERDAWRRLIRAPALGAQAIRRLLDRFGCAATVVERLVRDASAALAPAAARDALVHPDETALEADRLWLERPGHHLLTWLDDDYPALAGGIISKEELMAELKPRFDLSKKAL